MNGAQGSVDKGMELLRQHVQHVKEATEQMMQLVQSVGEEKTEEIRARLDEVVAAVEASLQELLAKAQALYESKVSEEYREKVSAILSSTITSLESVIAEAKKSSQEVRGHVQGVIDRSQQLVALCQERMTEYQGTVKAVYSDKVLNKINAIQQCSVEEFEKAMELVHQQVQKVRDASEKLTKLIRAAGEEKYQLTKEKTDDLKGKLEEVVENVEVSLRDLLHKAHSLYTNKIPEEHREKASAALQSVTTTLELVVAEATKSGQELRGHMELVVEKGQELMTLYQTRILELQSSYSDKVADAVNTVREKATAVKDQALDSGKQVKDAVDRCTDAVQPTITAAQTRVQEKYAASVEPKMAEIMDKMNKQCPGGVEKMHQAREVAVSKDRSLFTRLILSSFLFFNAVVSVLLSFVWPVRKEAKRDSPTTSTENDKTH